MLKSDPIKIIINQPTTPNEFTDIQGIIFAQSYKLLFFIFTLIAIVILFILLKGKFKRVENIDLPSPAEWALKELVKLQKKRLLEQQKIKTYHLDLSRILRVFFEKEYSFIAGKQTTNEFLENIQKNKQLKQHSTLLKKYLQMNDLAKFAEYKPDNLANLKIYELVKQIITSK